VRQEEINLANLTATEATARLHNTTIHLFFFFSGCQNICIFTRVLHFFDFPLHEAKFGPEFNLSGSRTTSRVNEASAHLRTFIQLCLRIGKIYFIIIVIVIMVIIVYYYPNFSLHSFSWEIFTYPGIFHQQD
jgi:hypothetical protein